MTNYKEVNPEINRWHEEFQNVRAQWVEWCAHNVDQYADVEHAWLAFQASLKTDCRQTLAKVSQLLGQRSPADTGQA